MNITRPPRRRSAYLMIEALVYISVVLAVLGVGYFAIHRFIDHSVTLRHYADDITVAVSAGERWRADVRACTNAAVLRGEDGVAVIVLRGSTRTVEYRTIGPDVFRRVDNGTWTRVLKGVMESTMTADPRGQVTAWRWELHLLPRVKTKAPPRVQPLFTFFAVPGRQANL